MPLQNRKPNLASLVVPPPRPMSDSQLEVHTPLPQAQFVYEPINKPLIMTPDTPTFNLPGIEATLTASEPVPWSEDEDSLVLSYIFHPPRPLRTAYPPGSLPPPQAIDELTSQITQSPVWSSARTWEQTRSRIFDLARKSSAEILGGPKREVDVPNTNVGFGRPKLQRPKLSVLGSSSMSRQQHSMDSLYGDDEPTMSEALRLSNTLQDTASRGSANQLTSTESLSSPLTFTFTFNPPPSRKQSHLPNSYPPRPTSLLQRGRSFTSQDIYRIPSTIDEYAISSDEEGTELPSPKKRHDMVRSVSSPVSSGFTTSPPSSVSSQVSEDNDSETSHNMMGLMDLVGYGNLQEVEVEQEPFTPLNQTFPNIHHIPRGPPPIRSVSSSSSDTTPAGTGRTTPAITLTVDSPTFSQTPRLLNPGTITRAGSSAASASAPSREQSSPTMSPTYTAARLANLSLDAKPSIPPPPPSAKRRTTLGSASLTRSFSDGIMTASARGIIHSSSVNSGLSTLTLSNIPAAPVHEQISGSGLGRPMIKRQRSNGLGLSVFVPRPAGRLCEELRSPFEHKPVSCANTNSQA